jgi:hypothetical protein
LEYAVLTPLKPNIAMVPPLGAPPIKMPLLETVKVAAPQIPVAAATADGTQLLSTL